MKTCPRCKLQYESDAEFCRDDGAQLLHDIDDTLVGTVLDARYRIESVIGEGGCGTVYLGQHTRLPRKVALKILNEGDRARPEEVARFRQEVAAIVTAAHPNIVGIYELGEHAELGVYVAMEYLEGLDLRDRLDLEGPLDVHEFLAISGDLMRALDVAHRKGIVHRDIKASNIFLARDSEGPVGFTVRLLNFGIAKVFAPEAARLPALDVTKETFVVGTPMTMSPEQARGLDVDARTDLYSAGVVIYEMLSGELPFDADNSGELMLKHCNDPPPPLVGHPRSAWVPPELDELVLSLLAKLPQDRPLSARHVDEELRSLRPLLLDAWVGAHYRPGADTGNDRLRRRPTTRPEGAGVGSEQVLVVDDEPAILDLVRLVLERAGYSCATVGRGREAASMLSGDVRPEALIVDLMMPDMDGIQLIDHAREVGYAGPILLFTTVRSEVLRADLEADETVILCDKTQTLPQLAELLQGFGVLPAQDGTN